LVQKLNFFTQNVRNVISLSIFCIYLYTKNNLEVIFMKKILLLPLFAAMALVSQAWGQECTSDGGTITYLCAWEAPTLTTNCWKLTPEDGKNCSQRATACGAGLLSIPTANLGTLSFGSTGTNCTGLTAVSGVPTFDATPDLGEGECKNGGTKQVFCQQPWGCLALDTRYSQIGEGGSTCGPSGTPCTCTQLVSDCPAGKLYVDVNKTTMPNDGNNQQCDAYGGTPFGGGGTSSSSDGNQPSSSSGGTDPIISYNSAAVTGLNVAHFARSLQIASGKDATVSLFNMHGKRVFSQKVLSGTTTISLEKQRQGVYYAVITSGSQKQTVKVILK
jgi:hypothetical protein